MMYMISIYIMLLINMHMMGSDLHIKKIMRISWQ